MVGLSASQSKHGQRLHLFELSCAGLMEQLLIEGKLSEEEIFMMSVDLLAVGIDTVSDQ